MPSTPSQVKTAPRTFAQRAGAYAVFLGLGSGVFILDRVTKLWVTYALPYNPYHDHGEGYDIVVIPGFFNLIHIGNTGAAWSIFSGRSLLLAAFAVITLAVIFHQRHKLGLPRRVPQIAFGLLCAGIVGNLIDRLVYKHVIDFIDLHFGSYIYPTFNVADSAILIGVIIYLWHAWKEPTTSEPN